MSQKHTYVKTHRSVHFKQVQFIAHQLYLGKSLEKEEGGKDGSQHVRSLPRTVQAKQGLWG